MKYLLCYTIYHEDGMVDATSEVYEDFSDALLRYTLCCGSAINVVLANMDEEKIMWQHTSQGRVVQGV